MDQLAYFALAVGADGLQDQGHPLLAQIVSEIMIVVIVGGYARGAIDRGDAAAPGNARRAILLFLGEQVRHANLESLAQLLELVVTQRQPVVLDLRQRRNRNARLGAHFLERPRSEERRVWKECGSTC